jgi:hypothetical protein
VRARAVDEYLTGTYHRLRGAGTARTGRVLPSAARPGGRLKTCVSAARARERAVP